MEESRSRQQMESRTTSNSEGRDQSSQNGASFENAKFPPGPHEEGTRLEGLELQRKLGSPNLPRHGRPTSRPASATGRVPSIVMLTSVDHSDATRYDL